MKKAWIILLGIVILIPLIITSIPLLLPFLLIAAVFVLKNKYPEIKGAVGEHYVNKILAQLGPNYQVFHDLYVPNEKGGTTQIDHVVTSPFGIFVIETKHYTGWIYGSEHQKYWTQVIYKRKEKLYNPIWQNYGHIQALKSYLDKEETDAIHSIIAFSSQSKLKFKDNFKSAKVIQLPQLIRTIAEWRALIISDTELQRINTLLNSLLIKDKKLKRQVKKTHVEAIKNSQKEQLIRDKIHSSQNKCPKCGGELALKNGKYGSFYGCSNYPKCRYTRRISSQ